MKIIGNTTSKKNDKPLKSTEKTYEFNSYRDVITNYFGNNFFNQYDISSINSYVKNPMLFNEEVRQISRYAYNSNGIVANTIDYRASIPTLDKVIVKRGKNKKKLKHNKELMLSALRTIKDKEFIRDCLRTDMIDGVFAYYCEVIDNTKNKFSKTMSDYDVESIVEINEITEINELGKNISMVALPIEYCKIVGIKNSSYVIAFNLNYFNDCNGEPIKNKLKKYPKEIREGYENYISKKLSNNWLVLDNTKTVVHKIRSKRSEKWGRPLVLAALNNILYSDYFIETKRNVLNELNNKIIYQTFPEGKEKGTSALSSKQQETQHNAVRDAVLNKNNTSGTSFFSVAAGTKINDIKVSSDIFDDKYESNLTDNIATDLGFGASLLNASSSGNYSSQQHNLELVCCEIFSWVREIEYELNKVINANIIKDEQNRVEVYYLPTTLVNRDKSVGYMSALYSQGKGSLQAWIASTGWDVEAYLSLMDEELEEDFENRYPVHKTSYTLSGKDADNSDVDHSGGRPENKNATNNQTIQTKTNNGNDIPRINK